MDKHEESAEEREWLNTPAIEVLGKAGDRLRETLEKVIGDSSLRAFVSTLMPKDFVRLRGVGKFTMGEIVKCLAAVPSAAAHNWAREARPFVPRGFMMPSMSGLSTSWSGAQPLGAADSALETPLATVLAPASHRLQNALEFATSQSMSAGVFIATFSPRRFRMIRRLGPKGFAEFCFYLKRIEAPAVERWLRLASQYLQASVTPLDILDARIEELEDELASLKAERANAVAGDGSPIKRPNTYFPEVLRWFAAGDSLGRIGERLGINASRVGQLMDMTLEIHLPALDKRIKRSPMRRPEFLRMHRAELEAHLAKVESALAKGDPAQEE